MPTLVINQSICSECGAPSGHCDCRAVALTQVFASKTPAAAAAAENRYWRLMQLRNSLSDDDDYLPPTGPSVLGDQQPKSAIDRMAEEDEVMHENRRRLGVNADDDPDGPLIPPTIDWQAEVDARQRLRDMIDGPCDPCPDDHDYLPLPRL